MITAGRCISAADEMRDITCMIPVCAVSGKAAGAAMSDDFAAMDVAALQAHLPAGGVHIHNDFGRSIEQ